MKIWTATAVAITLTMGIVVSAQAADRTHYIAAEEVDWDYAPLGRDEMMGHAFSEDQSVFVESGPETIGRHYRKAVYRAYTDETFTTRVERPAEWAHLGVLGPVLHAEVGDTIRVVFRNNASRPYTMHPHGVFYDKASEGTAYNDGTSGADKADDGVAPGATHVYEWRVPERAGPGPNDPSSIPWLYHSHVDEPMDTNTGLVGAIIVTRAGEAHASGRPADIEREFVTLYTVFDENLSWYLADNTARFATAADIDPENETFVEGNLMHAINGYVFANIPGLDAKICESIRWYTIALGTEVDLHTPHWHGNTGLSQGHRVDTVELMPATSKVVDMQADNAGVWMFHCHVNDHIGAGMTALYRVADVPGASCD